MNTLSKPALLVAGLAISAANFAAPTVNNFTSGGPGPGVDRYQVAQPDHLQKYQIGTQKNSQLQADRLAAAVAADLGNRLEGELELLLETVPTYGRAVITD